MKNLFKLFVPVAAAAIALVSCQPKEEQIGNNPAGEVTIRVHASAQAIAGEDTKTYIDTYQGTANTILWGTGEYMKLALTAGENTTFATSTDASADTFNGDPEAMFEFSVTPETASEYVYQGLYPASAAATSNNTNAANYKVNLPAIQNATASSYDPAAYIMVAKPETFTSVQTDWEASYRRATALNKITLKNFASSVSINKVKITAEGKKLAGGRHFNLTTGEGLEVYGTDATIEVLYASPISGTSMDVWFTSWNTEIAEGEKLTIVAYTTDKKSYTKEITVPAGKTIKFQEGYLNTLGAKFDGIAPKDVTSLDGDYVILAKHNTSYYALKGEASTTRIASVDYTGSTTSFEGDASLVWTIATSGDGYTIKNGSNFIGWTSGSGNAADLVDENDYDATKCLMVIEKDGDVYHIKVSADQSRVLAKNTGSAYFAFYASTGQYSDIVLVPATALETVATPTFSPVAGEVASGTEVTISTATSGATIYYTTDGSVPTTSSTQGNSVTITAATTIKAIAVKEGMANSEVATAQYTITGVIDYSVIETSNVTLSSTGGTSASTATVNSESALKAGTGTAAGAVKLTVPAGTTTLHLHAAGWNGENVELGITGATASPSSLSLTADSGIKNNSPFTLSGNAADYYFCISLSGISTDTDLTFSATSGKRFVIWGVNAVADTRDDAPISWSANTGSATFSSTGTSYDLPSLNNTNTLSVSYSSSEESVATINASGVITAIAAGTSTISATYDGSAPSAPYKTTTVSYTLTVTNNRTACATPSFSPAAGEVTSGSTITISSATEGASIYYTTGSSDFSAGDWTAYTEPIAITSACTIKAIAVKSNFKDSEVSSAAYTITVPTVGSGTEADPYTAGDILDKYPSGSGDTEVYVTGTITNIQEVSTSFGNATYTISDGSRNILVYRGKYIGNVNFTSEDQIALNDIVVVFGKIGVYKETPQLAQNNYLISITKDPTTPTISVSPASLSWEATETDSKTLTVTLNGSAAKGDYNYSVTSGTAADWTISDNGEGVITVTPNAANTDKNNAKEITITIAHKSDSNVKQEVTCSQAKASSGGYSTTTYTKVTSAPSDWSGTYILVYEETSTSGRVCTAGEDAASNYETATIASGVISSNDLSDYEVEIATYSTGYSVKALGGSKASKYLEGKGSSSNGTNFASSPSKVTTFALSNGVVTITNNTNVFAYNSAANNYRWRFFKSATANGSGYYKPALYKKN